MMAFFMLMWLLGATTEEQRKGIADYFDPTVITVQTSAGGESMFGGDSLLEDKTMAQTGTGQSTGDSQKSASEAAASAQEADLKRLQSVLEGKGGESQTMERLLSHVVTKVSDEGLVIDVFDTADSPLFENDSAMPTQTLIMISALLTDVLSITSNAIAVEGHVRAYPVTLIKNPSWDLSAARAQALRQVMEQAGLEQSRIARISGHADRKPVTANLMSVRNNRVEVILLRSDR
jgi:chemotaxis protein MotB